MSDLKELLDREARRVDEAPDALGSVLRRRDRKRRTQRIAAGVVGIAVFVAAIWIVTSGAWFDRTETPAVTGPTDIEPTYNGPTYKLGSVTEEDIAVGKAFAQAWVARDGEAAAATFSPRGRSMGSGRRSSPRSMTGSARADGRSGTQVAGSKGGASARRRRLQLHVRERPHPDAGYATEGFTLSFVMDAGRIETAWFGGGGVCGQQFGSPDPGRVDLFGPVWDMFIEWISSNHPEDFDRMYDPDYGYPIPGYPILDATSIRLWEQYTDEFVALPPGSFTEWLANQSFEVRARRICLSNTKEFWETDGSGRDLHGRAFDAGLANVSEETLAELRALPLRTEADRAAMDAFVPLAEQWIELWRQGGGRGPAKAGFFERRDLQISMGSVIDGCLISYGLLG